MKKRFGQITDYLKEHEYFDRQITGEEIFSSGKRPGVGLPLVIAVILSVGLCARLFILQVEQGYLNLRLAEGNRLKTFSSAAPRGIIYDSAGAQLVSNEPSYQLTLDSTTAKNYANIDKNVWKIVGLEETEAEKIIKNRDTSLEYVVLKDRISREDALLFKSRLADYEGFEIRPFYTRKYLVGSLGHVLGYIGKSSETDIRKNQICAVNEYSGKSGLEKTYDSYLQGTPGEKKTEINVSGQSLRVLSSQDPVVGDSIYTSIDQGLQEAVSQALKKKADELQTKGTAIVLDPQNGEVKAMVNYPDYDNTKMSSGMTQSEYDAIANDKNQPLLNRATSGEYPAGSSIKPFIALTALEERIVDKKLSFDTPAYIEIGQWKFPDWKDHGTTNIERAIAESNNIFFYALGGGWGPIKNGLGPAGIKKGLEKLGFGSKTEIDLSAESNGFIPTPEWKKKTTGESWFIGNTYNMSIGQGDLLVTPLQIANATSTIASSGKQYKPHFIKKIVTPSGEIIRDFKKEDFLVSENQFSKDNLQTVREGMRMTVTDGSAHSIFGDNFPMDVAAKTGTAQFGTEGKTHAWFASFAPYDNPQLVVVVLIEGGGEGYQSAAPVAKEIYSWWQQNRM